MPKDKRRRSRSKEKGRKSRSRSRSRSGSSRHCGEKHRARERTSYYESSSRCRSRAETDSEGDRKNVPLVFSDYKSELDCLFFTDRDVIKNSSSQYEEFWKFYAKLQAMQARQGGCEWIPPKCDVNGLGVPSEFHRSFLFNFGLNLPHPEKLLGRLPVDNSPQGRRKPALTKLKIMEFHQILLLYLEFLQKEKIQKLKKLRESQEKLPIAQYRDEIVKSVQLNKVTIIAGELHCCCSMTVD